MQKTLRSPLLAALLPVSLLVAAGASPGQNGEIRQPGVGEPGGPYRPLTGEELVRFLNGRAVFDRDFDRAMGLGTPELNADSCRACHQDPAIGGAGSLELNVSRFAYDNGGAGPYQDLPGGQAASRLRPPWVEGRENYVEEADVFEQRQTPSLFGAGFIDAIYESSILANADPDDLDGDGIKGIARMIEVADQVRRIEPGFQDEPELVVERIGGSHFEVGRFGWKSQIPRLEDFMRDAMAGENGITTVPDGRGFGLVSDADTVADPELSLTDLEDMLFFVSLLTPPIAEDNRDPLADVGETYFQQIGCAKCHVPSLEGSLGPVELYSDLLLHNVMPDGFRGMQEPGAPAGFFRTVPLWGCKDTFPYMHDGRAETLRDAILMHHGEAEEVRGAFERLSAEEQEALLTFLDSL